MSPPKVLPASPRHGAVGDHLALLSARLELCEAVGDKGIIGSRVGNTTGEHLHNNTLDTQRPSHWSFGLYQKYCY